VADVPGSYQLVDHSMFRAFNKGAMGALEIEGPIRSDIFPGKLIEMAYNPGTRLDVAVSIPAVVASARAGVSEPEASQALLERGRKVYDGVCAACHQADAQGLPGIFPPLARSDYLMADPDRAVRILLQGLNEPITVNGKQFKGIMPKLPLSDQEIVAVLRYVRGNFGNQGSAIRLADVGRVRAALDGAVQQREQVAIDP
jgi:nitrite reductase (NO-forming)